MIKTLKNFASFVKEGVWRIDADAFGLSRRIGVNLLRFASATFSSFTGHPTGLHAAGLTYFTILGFVPVLCLLMVCAKMCGVDHMARNKINEQIDTFIAQVEEGQAKANAAAAAAPREKDEAAQAEADDKARTASLKADATMDIARQVRAFSNETFDRVAKVDLSTLGWIGFGMLMWTVVSTLGQVESSFNEVWAVGRGRPIWLKFPLYLFIVVVLPILATFAMSMPIIRAVKTALDATLGATSYTKWVGDALVAFLTSRIFGFVVTFTFASMAFALLLKLMPYCKVRFRTALEAGALTALLTGAWLKICTTAGIGIAKSSAMYGSFAAVPIMLAWIYVSWQIVLLGSCMSYAFECVHSRRLLDTGR
ncbi:MAG: YihY/virulence factor BrkB family protein [Kiritimatiellae bacterium]|nr:YihY/virulence factor BrkB family protein [Kiritimatiellia bacterium]